MPRLSKGEIAPGTLAKSSATKRTIQCRVETFNLMVKENDLHSLNWVNFTNVDSLASWHNESLGIRPVSPKTLRKHVADLYDGGLTNLLVAARNIVRGRDSKSTNSQRTSRVSELEAKISLAVDSSLEMTARYLDLLEKLQKLAKDNESASIELSRHFRRYEQNPHLKLVK